MEHGLAVHAAEQPARKANAGRHIRKAKRWQPIIKRITIEKKRSPRGI